MPPSTDSTRLTQAKSSLISRTRTSGVISSHLSNRSNSSGGENSNQKANTGIGGGSEGAGSGTEVTCLQAAIFDGDNFNILDDDDATVIYRGDWRIITGDVNAGDFTQHETLSQSASIFAPFSGSQITVVGTVPNGTDNITASYSIDGALPQIRIVPTNTGCDIPDDPFFTISGLREGNHNITVTVEQVGSRPFMFNFFALDPDERDFDKTNNKVAKLDAGEIAGVVFAGVLVCFLCFAIAYIRRRKLRLRKKQTVNTDQENPDVDVASICSSCKHQRITPFEADLNPRTTTLDRNLSNGESGSLSAIEYGQYGSPIQKRNPGSSVTEFTNQATRMSATTRATRGSGEISSSRSFPSIHHADEGVSKTLRSGANGVIEDEASDAEGSWASRRGSSESSATLVSH
ncbi:hypothetical protein SCHPADRAFT_940445 [Schizopora paradoxa]|uniref:Uncharacterized protein n=1 Tax=Schizopora paradoxa TaxID=27342 RepID=A0A0H2S8Y3_9AGAM|nr:hypothetical protein SCHPADRAFT_940445 [Schizopora paradoxa]